MQQIFFYLVLLASGSRGLNQLLQDSQAHQCDVFHHYRCLYVDRHEEQAEGYIWGRSEGKQNKRYNTISRRLLTALIQQNLFQNNIRGKKKKR